MKFDFDTLVNRRDKYSRKWQMMDDRAKDIDCDIPPFSVADYDFKYPVKLTEGFKSYVDEMIFGYSAPDDAYYNSFINWVERRHGFTIKRDWIINGNGVVSGICNAIRTFSNVGDGVIIMTPVYPPFFKSVERNERKIIDCELINNNGHYEIDFGLLERQCVVSSNKILIMCSPHNPVGRVWTKDDLEKVDHICRKYGVLVISDEIHMDLLLDGHKHIVYSSISDYALNNSVILTSAGKSFNLAGTRTSFIIIANKEKRELYDEYVSENCHVKLNAFGFKLFEIAYNECEDWFNELLQLIENNYKLMKNYIETNLPLIKVTPLEGTYLMWLDMKGLGLSDDDLFDFLVDECQIFINRGDFFGRSGSGFIRFNIATPKWAIEDALERLNSGVRKLNL